MLMLIVVVSPESATAARSVMIQNDERQIVAVMNTRIDGSDQAVKLALDFVEAAANSDRLAAALETIRTLRMEVMDREARSVPA
jgi:hypothetical protein